MDAGQIVTVLMTGLSAARALPGQHGTIGAAFSDGAAIETYRWGAALNGNDYGTGPNPSDFTAQAGGVLHLRVTRAGRTYRSSAPIAPLAPAVIGPVSDQTVTLGAALPALDLSAYVTGTAPVYSITAGSLPEGLILAGSVISGTATRIQAAGEVTVTVANGAGSATLVLRFTVVAGAAMPVLTETQPLNDATHLWGVVSDQPGGVIAWARLAAGASPPQPDGAGGWSQAVLESGTVPYTGGPLDIPETGTTGTRYELAVHHYAGGQSSNVLMSSYTADNTAPVLSDLAVTVGDGTAAVALRTDEGDGTLYWQVTAPDETPDAAALRAANARPVTAAGAQEEILLSGLANGAARRISLLQEDTRRNASAVVSAVLTPGTAAALTRLASTTLISDDSNQEIYAAAPHTAAAGADLLVAIVTLCNASAGPDTVTAAFGSVPMLRQVSHLPPVDNLNPAVAVFYLPAAAIPAGAQVLEITCLNGTTPQRARAMHVELVAFSGARQTDPLYTGPLVDHGAGASTDLASPLALQAAGDHHLSVYTRRGSGSSALPMTSDATLLETGETGAAASSSVSTLVTASQPAAAGPSTHVSGLATAARTFSLSIGVRQA
jgi:hypothetical protein